MIPATWDLYVTDRTGGRIAQVDVYESAEVHGRVNDVSTWRVTLPTDTPAGQLFITDSFARLEVALNHALWRSGPMLHLEREVTGADDMLTVSGVDDTVWLARRVATPGVSGPPFSTVAYDVHTGAMTAVLAELVNVNAGPGATASRAVPGLTVPVPAAGGPNITVSARWQNLLTLLQDTARPEGIVFDIVGLVFRAYPGVNRGAVFSFGLETLAAWKMTAEAAKVNYTYIAGQGVGTARLILSNANYPSIDTWGRAEAFIDRRDTTDHTEMFKAGREAIAAGMPPTTVLFTPLDTEGQRFGYEWGLGDVVTVQAGGLTVVDQVREVHVTLNKSGATIVPAVGAPSGDLALFRSLAGLDQRLRQLERV